MTFRPNFLSRFAPAPSATGICGALLAIAMGLCAAALLFFGLSGCGGGGDCQGPGCTDVPTPRVNCAANPEACK